MVSKYFYHENNIIGKTHDTGANKAYRRIFKEFIGFKEHYYDPYKNGQLQITGIAQADIYHKVELLNAYYEELNKFIEIQRTENNVRITSQSKLRPTVLEEFCGFLLKDIPQISSLGLDFFNKDIFVGIVLDSRGQARLKTKNVDFCLGKKFPIIIGDDSREVIIPIIAIEVKTYLDKTMFGESQWTAQTMKHGSPNVVVYILTEDNEVAKEEIPTKGQTPIEQIFVIRGNERNQINSEAVYSFFSDVKQSLENLSREVVINEIGPILPH
jgi:hypothetical protein